MPVELLALHSAQLTGITARMNHLESALPRFQWRRLFQYKLRSLFFLTTVLAVWFATLSNSARRQRDAVAALRKMDAQVTYDYEQQGLKWPSRWPPWLVDSIGVDYFADIKTAGLVNAPWPKGQDLEILRGFTSLEQLTIRSSKITDADLRPLQGMTGLQQLILIDTRVTEAGSSRLNESLPGCSVLRYRLYKPRIRCLSSGTPTATTAAALLRSCRQPSRGPGSGHVPSFDELFEAVLEPKPKS